MSEATAVVPVVPAKRANTPTLTFVEVALPMIKEGKTSDEIGAILGIKGDTVEQKYNKLRKENPTFKFPRLETGRNTRGVNKEKVKSSLASLLGDPSLTETQPGE